jgi:hypothetical protein
LSFGIKTCTMWNLEAFKSKCFRLTRHVLWDKFNSLYVKLRFQTMSSSPGVWLTTSLVLPEESTTNVAHLSSTFVFAHYIAENVVSCTEPVSTTCTPLVYGKGINFWRAFLNKQMLFTVK